MQIFLFQVLPIVALAALVAGVVLLFKGISSGNRKLRFLGMGSVVVFALLLVFVLLQAFVRL